MVDYTMKSQDGTIHTLESTKEERDLVVLIDNQLSFKSHILSKVTRIIRNSFTTTLDHTTFPQLFKSLVRSQNSTLRHPTNDWNNTATATADFDKLTPVTEKVVKPYSDIPSFSNDTQIP